MSTQPDNNAQTAPTINRIALVGHCSFDSASLTHAASRVPGIEQVERINDDKALAQAADGSALLLINRVLDGRFSVDHGVDLIKKLKASSNGRAPRMMLISNFEDAQAAAIEAGALPGFGKNDTHSPAATEKLHAAVGA